MLNLYRILANEERNFGVSDLLLEQSPSSDQDWERFEKLVDEICKVQSNLQEPRDFKVSTLDLLQTDSWSQEQLETILSSIDGYFLGWVRAEADATIAELAETVVGRQPRQFYYRMKSDAKVFLPWATNVEEIGRIKIIKYLCEECELGQFSLDLVPAGVAENTAEAFCLEEIPDVNLPMSNDGFVYSDFFVHLSEVEPNPCYQQEPF